MRIAAAFLLVMVLLESPVGFAVTTQNISVVESQSSISIDREVERTVQAVLQTGVQSEWQAIALVRAGKQVPQTYNTFFETNLKEQVIQKLGSGRMKITDVERLTIAAIALGKNPQYVNGQGLDLIDKIVNSERWSNGEDSITFQGNNGVIFALIALDAKQTPISPSSKWTREKLVATLLETQKENGSWSLERSKTGTTSFDITAMAITALAPYREQLEVKQAVQRAVDFLAVHQGPTGGFEEAFVGGVTSEATSQVIIGLTANEIDPRSTAFTKNGIDLVEHLLSFRADDGGFKHTTEDKQANGMATEQALQALVAYQLYTKGEGAFYRFEERVQPVVFNDIHQHWAKVYIEEAAAAGVLKGYPDGSFRPNQQLTRSQAISIIVRALKLEGGGQAPFQDLENVAKETQREIAAAYAAGLVQGSNGRLMPANHVTRAQMALMLHRAYKIKTGKPYTTNNRTPFKDIGHLDVETIAAISMLYELEMATGSNGNFMPGQPTTRAHAAKMLNQFFQHLE